MSQAAYRLLPVSPAANLARTVLDRLGRYVQHGSLEVILPDGTRRRYDGRDNRGPAAVWEINDYRALWSVLMSESIGFGESYAAGYWNTPSLAALLRFAALNDRALMQANPAARWLDLPARLAHWWRSNSRRQARRNIAHHYDLGNAFYAAWLDSTMTYSAAVFEGAGDSLAVAQAAKYARLAGLAGVEDGDRVLEIGCGWGGFLEHAARSHAVQLTGISISREQCNYAHTRLERAGLTARADVQFCDYRDVSGTFDRIVSIEMFEAVGEAYWHTYANRLRELLRPGGTAALQVITIDEARFAGYRKSPDFIQAHIFPGGMLPSRERLRAVLRDAGLVLDEEIAFGQDYARTLSAWRARFEANWPAIQGLGFDERFRRLWLFYLQYCEAGFTCGATDVVHLAVRRP